LNLKPSNLLKRLECEANQQPGSILFYPFAYCFAEVNYIL